MHGTGAAYAFAASEFGAHKPEAFPKGPEQRLFVMHLHATILAIDLQHYDHERLLEQISEMQ
jgi:hypothetical protein